jgi:UDP-GlcNAc3NAcA epimerase
MKKIITILGARPQFIKAAAVSRAFEQSNLKEIIVHTGQHFDKNMSDIFFEQMEIPKPDYMLNINSLSHGAMTGRMLEEIEKVIDKENPDAVMIYGDTNSTIAGALAARKLQVKVIHVEAGLRSFNMAMPEEVNRILTDRISDFLFCPTQTAIDNLAKEGYEHIGCHIENVGDVMYDAALFYSQKADAMAETYPQLKLSKGNFVLATVHRQENTDDPERLKGIFEALNEINKQKRVILPLHPRTRKIIEKNGLQLDFEPIDPVGYFDIIQLLKNATMVLTDSGGMQKEAYFFNKYCLTLRDETEWVELVENGVNELVGADKELILSKFNEKINKTFPAAGQLNSSFRHSQLDWERRSPHLK